VYEGTYWDLLANIGELTEALTQMAVGPTVLEEPVLQLPPSPTLPSWDSFKPVLQPLPPLPQVLCCAVLRCAVLCCAVLCCDVMCCAALCWPALAALCYADYAGRHSAVLRCVMLCHHLFFLNAVCFKITPERQLLAAEVKHASASTSSHTRAGHHLVCCSCHLCKCHLDISILLACSPA